mgnify:CR=1 FL=1
MGRADHSQSAGRALCKKPVNTGAMSMASSMVMLITGTITTCPFDRRNANASIDESFARFASFLPDAKREGLRARGYVSTCFGCPYEGPVKPEKVVDVARRLVDVGCQEISIGDTISDAESPQALTRISVDEPTMSMVFKVNDGPLAGREGKYVIRDAEGVLEAGLLVGDEPQDLHLGRGEGVESGGFEAGISFLVQRE